MDWPLRALRSQPLSSQVAILWGEGGGASTPTGVQQQWPRASRWLSSPRLQLIRPSNRSFHRPAAQREVPVWEELCPKGTLESQPQNRRL